MKNLVIYYSHTGITKNVAQKIAEVLSCETEEIIEYKNRKGILGWFISIYDTKTKKLTQIKPISKDLSYYDHILIGTPVWALNLPPAVRTFVNEHHQKFNQVSFFCTMGSFGSKNVFKELEFLCRKQPIKKVDFKTSEIKSNKYLEKIKEFEFF